MLLLALALGATTQKMHHGHPGANHPVKDLETGKVEITSQNHGFVVDGETLPGGVTATHLSLFDGSLEGLKLEGKVESDDGGSEDGESSEDEDRHRVSGKSGKKPKA